MCVQVKPSERIPGCRHLGGLLLKDTFKGFFRRSRGCLPPTVSRHTCRLPPGASSMVGRLTRTRGPGKVKKGDVAHYE